MTPPTKTPVSALPKGYEFAQVEFTVEKRDVAAYLAAVGDSTPYGDAVPPLAAVALALQALQEQVALPEGSLHTGQEVSHHAIVEAGEPLMMRGRVGMRSERQGFVISALDYEILRGGETLISARTTIMAPAASVNEA